MNRIVHAEARSRSEEAGDYTRFILFLVDKDTGKEISSEEAMFRFLSFSITGVYVMQRRPIRRDLPAGGKIGSYTATHVVLEDGTAIPKKDFHQLYEID